jgi:hypothetical protein
VLVFRNVPARLRIVAIASFCTLLACGRALRSVDVARPQARRSCSLFRRASPQAATARRCSASKSVVSLFQTVPPNYSFKRTAMNHCGKLQTSRQPPLNSRVSRHRSAYLVCGRQPRLLPASHCALASLCAWLACGFGVFAWYVLRASKPGFLARFSARIAASPSPLRAALPQSRRSRSFKPCRLTIRSSGRL